MGMDFSVLTRRGVLLFGAALMAIPAAAAPAAAHPTNAGTAFAEIDLVSDVPGRAPLVDPELVNPWGLALSATSPLWVANNGTNLATVYPGGVGGAPVTKAGLTVSLSGGAVNGEVANDTTDFVVTTPTGSGPARFIFSSETGDITAWNPAATGTTAVAVAHAEGAIYRGMALLHTDTGPFLLAADFKNARIAVFDKAFQPVQQSHSFLVDHFLPRGYAPFNVAVLGDAIYVAYAKQDATGENEVAGSGLGFVDRFDLTGRFTRRMASHGPLNAPWGLAIAPASFGQFAGDLLVGNFGDGRISAYDAHGHFRGQLRDAHHKPITIDGLWALLPGTATTGGTDGLWFSAGIEDEEHGLVGQIRAVA
jgi:uncharacterized protein (TIGR03118 family)